MGKGNRTRTQRANRVLTAPTAKKVQRKKRGMPTWAGTAIVVAVLLVLVLFTTFMVLNSRGTFARMQVVCETENFKVTAPMMTYAVYTQRQNLISMYEQYGSSSSVTPTIGGGTYGDALDTSSMDLRSQVYSRVEKDGAVEKTWFDHFAESAETAVRQMLASCELARYYGMNLTEEDYAQIDATIASIETYAKSYAQYGYTTDTYVELLYGDGVNLKDVRAMLELSQLASKYQAVRQQEIINAISDDRIQEEYSKNPAKYDIYMGYIGYTFEAKFTPETGENADNTDEIAAYEALKTKYAARVEALAKANDAQAFSALLYSYFYEDALESERTAALDKKKAALEEGADASQVTLTEEEEAKCAENAANTAKTKLKTATVADYASASDPKDFDKWLFETKTVKDSEGKDVTVYVRKPGDTKKFETATEAKAGEDGVYSAVSSTYAVYVTTNSIHCDSSMTHNVGHILFKSETFDGMTDTSSLTGKVKELADRVLAKDGVDMLTAYAMAIELLDMLLDEGKITLLSENGKTYYVIEESVFEEYGLVYTEDGNVFYNEVGEGEMVEEFEAWLFDAAREMNEISYPEPIGTKYGSHIMMYRGSMPAWKVTIRDSLANTEYDAWLQQAVADTPIEFNAKKWKYVAR